MKRLNRLLALILGVFACLTIQAQQATELSKALNDNSFYFTLGPQYQLTGEVRELLKKELTQNQFVGLAELHGSQQLSLFTTGFINLLREAEFVHFALEMGPYQANAITALSRKPHGLGEQIRQANRTYGSKLLQITPLVFANHKEDALFLENATDTNMRLWGLDQEHIFSFEMHFDTLYHNVNEKSEELTKLYKESKSIARKWSRKEVLKPKFKMSCELIRNETLDQFLQAVSTDEESRDRVADIHKSWEIYCDSESGRGSNQKRANYMKVNFDSLLRVANANSRQPKVFLKFGSVHLTRGKSPFGVNDIGQHVSMIADRNQSGFLTIRHLKRYLNGKDLIGKKGWGEVTSFMRLGKKDQWTLIDLRPLRALQAAGKLTCTKREAFEINSYDLMLISPDDHKAKQNF